MIKIPLVGYYHASLDELEAMRANVQGWVKLPKPGGNARNRRKAKCARKGK